MANDGAGIASFERMLFSLAPEVAAPAARADALARAALGPDWVLRPRGATGRSFEARPAEGRAPGMAEAWSLTHRLRAASGVAAAEPVFVAALGPPRDGSSAGTLESGIFGPGPEVDPAWPLDQVDLAGAWAFLGGSRGEGVVIGHPDTGYTRHPDVVAAFLVDMGLNFVEGTRDPLDPLQRGGVYPTPGHGTGTASVIAGKNPDFGVAPAARIVPFRVSDSVVLASMANLSDAIDAAVVAGAHVISISLGGLWSATLEGALQRAVDAGVIVLAAAGNYVGFVTWPAAYPDVIAVAASAVDRRPWDGSCRGSAVAITAPGARVLHAEPIREPDGDVDFERKPGNGTSFAVAMVAGVAALWLAHHGRANLLGIYGPNLSRAFRTVLVKNADPGAGPWQGMGTGILNAQRVVSAPLPALADLVPLPTQPTTWLGRIAHMLGGLGAADPLGVIGDALGRTPAEVQQLPSSEGEELAFHLAVQPELRKLLVSSQVSLLEGAFVESVPRELRAGSARARLLGLASPELGEVLVQRAAPPAPGPSPVAPAAAAASPAMSLELATVTAPATPPPPAAPPAPAKTSILLGLATTGIDAQVDLRMARVPTGVIHLLDRPLVRVTVTCTPAKNVARIRVRAWVEGYSAQAVETVEVSYKNREAVDLLPTFFPAHLRSVTEMTRATLRVEVDDLDGPADLRVERHSSLPIWLLPRTSAALSVDDPTGGPRIDLTPYLGAWVTPNAAEVLEVLRGAAGRQRDQRMVGYQVGAAEVESQVAAIFAELHARGLLYVNSTLTSASGGAEFYQRVRLPREALANRSANCIDGTVLMASVLEAASINAALVIVPGHAFLGWETWRGTGIWSYLETTLISGGDFAAARAAGEARALKHQADALQLGSDQFRRRAVPDLRAAGVLPME